MVARLAAFTALAGAIVLVALVLFNKDNEAYRVRILTVNAGQVVKDNEVRIGGAAVGTVARIQLTDQGLAQLTLSINKGVGRLHEGTKAVVRSQSLVGSANHFVSLVPGPASGKVIPDDGVIGTESSTAPVDFDALLDTLDTPTRDGLGQLIRGLASQYKGKSKQARRALQYFAPFLGDTSRLLDEFSRDRAATTKLITQGAVASHAVAGDADRLTDLVSHTAETTGAIANQSAALDQALRRLPTTFRKANSTFVNLRATFDDLDPLVDAAKPATKNLALFLRRLTPLTEESVPAVRNLADVQSSPGANNDLADLLNLLPSLSDTVTTGAPVQIKGFNDSQRYIDKLLDYTPDITSAVSLLNQAASYYDANGHYVRNQPSLFALAYDQATNSLSRQPDSNRLSGLETGKGARCPGGATQRPADNSAPADSHGCDPTDVLP